jgi:geranylgeranyl pyrophosphate synthase
MLRATDSQKELIYTLQSNRNCPPKEKIRAIKSLYEYLGVRELTNNRIQHYYNRAMNVLTGLSIPAARIQTLCDTINLLLGRQF